MADPFIPRGHVHREPYAGSPPFVRGSDTSKAAADSVEADTPTLRERVYAAIKGYEDRGATDDCIEQQLKLRHQTASARRRELQLLGMVVDSGRRRETRSGRKATVWVAVDKPVPVQPKQIVREPRFELRFDSWAVPACLSTRVPERSTVLGVVHVLTAVELAEVVKALAPLNIHNSVRALASFKVCE
jgi:hypothetical protein